MYKLASATLVIFFLLLSVFSCKKTAVGEDDVQGRIDSDSPSEDGQKTVPPIDFNSIKDTYKDIAPIEFYKQWGSHNVHDPSIRKFGEYYYCYSTDVSYGGPVRSGIQIRRSEDLIVWNFVNWVFSSIPSQASVFIHQHGGIPSDGIWAPNALKVNDEYRLYYAISSSTPRLSVIGLAVSSSPEGPWKERGLVVTSADNMEVQTNAIDPSVVITPEGDQWMYYGSAWDGIYVLRLDPSTGLAMTPDDAGMRIAQRGFTNGNINGNIEAPEIIYNSDLKKYFLFLSYDWLETKYNVRVGRSDNPDGPFYDINGNDLNLDQDDDPMILAPYQFNGHEGWQGTGGECVFSDGEGNYFMGHNARPAIDKFFMNLHVRKIFWTEEGWPIISPERYALEDNSLVPGASLIGKWEQIILGYLVVPGYGDEQADPNLQTSIPLSIDGNGTLNDDPNSRWSYSAPWLEMNWGNGFTDNVFIQSGYDWENQKETVILTGLNNDGTAIWGKKID